LYRSWSSLLLGLLLGPVFSVWGQTATVRGKVTDLDTYQPVPLANVFVAGSTLGASTNAKGEFVITGIPVGAVEIVGTFVGYAPFRRQLMLLPQTDTALSIYIKPTTQNLKEVTITAKVDKAWRRRTKRFETFLLGHTNNADKCLITNIDDVQLFENEETKELTATAAAPLVIENRALGYRITYWLETFSVNARDEYKFAGVSRFDTLAPKDDKERQKWQQTRAETYRGSLKHFLRYLAAGQFASQTFALYASKWAGKEKTETFLPDPGSLLLYGETDSERLLKFTGHLNVTYNGRVTGYGGPARTTPNYQVSWLRLSKPAAAFMANGHLLEPLQVVIYGYWANEGLANMLPYEYENPEIDE
jgi:CarboxypepD_reg-like domain